MGAGYVGWYKRLSPIAPIVDVWSQRSGVRFQRARVFMGADDEPVKAVEPIRGERVLQTETSDAVHRD